MARPVVQYFLQKLEADPESGFNIEAEFPAPPPGFLEFIDCNKYKQIRPEEEQRIIQDNKAKMDEFDDEFIDEEFDEEFDEELDEEFEEEFE